MLRIVHLGKYYPPAPGGIETHLRTLALTQAKLGMEVQVICVNHADRTGQDITWSKWERSATVAELDGPVRVLRLGRLACLARLDLCPHLLRELRRLGSQRVDVIHMQAPNPTMILACILSGMKAPIVVTHHSDIVRQRYLKHAFHPFESYLYRRAASLFTDSPQYVEGSKVLQRFRDKVAVLPLGIDLSPYIVPSPEALDMARKLRSEGEPLWLLVGRLIYYKGIDVALKALVEVPGRLLIVGSGPLESSLRRLAHTLGIADRVIWHGHATPDELVGAFHAATALWFPSNERSEAFGLVQVEAMASGCPVINTSIPDSGVSWVSLHEQTGLTTPVNDPHAFAVAARRIWEERGLRERLGRQGRERAIQWFSQERMAEQSLQLYEQARKNH